MSFGDFILNSVERAQQGDPLAVFYFCLAMNEMLIELISIFKSGYIDDITLGDKNIEAVLDDLKTVLAHGEKIGIELNQKNKSELIVITSEKRKEILAQFREIFPYIASTLPDYMTLLGAPIGQKPEISAVEAKLDDLKRMCYRLEALPAHVAFFLLKKLFLHS